MTKQKKIATCKFCTKSRQLCKSHIQPRWLYRERGTNFKLIASDAIFEKSAPIGPYEHLLCLECEGLMGKYDDYSATFFKGSRWWPRDERTNWRVIFQYDYSLLKLFMLSMLWRAGVAQTDYFANVVLSEPVLDDLHSMIEKRDAGNEQDYSVMIQMREPRGGLEKVGRSPYIKKRSDNLEWCRFDLNEFSCDIKISKDQTSMEPKILLTDRPPILVVTGPTYTERLLEFKDQSLARSERERVFREEQAMKKLAKNDSMQTEE